MSWSDVAITAVAVACFNLLGWCLSLSRRLGHIERTTATNQAGEVPPGAGLEPADAKASDNIPEPIVDEPMAGRIPVWERPLPRLSAHAGAP